MNSLENLFLHSKKEEMYEFLKRINPKKTPKYESITKKDIYNSVLALYKEDPEIILNICSMEEIEILKLLLVKTIPEPLNYVDYIVFEKLKKNYLIMKDKEYYIPDDIINYVKMAINLFDFKEYSIKDIKDSVLLGIARIYNVILVDDLIPLLEEYSSYIDSNLLHHYIAKSYKLRDKIDIIKYNQKYYMVSKECNYYKDVLKLKDLPFKKYPYTLESVISIGKYKINLFDESIFNYLHFLEEHLEPCYIDSFLDDLLLYCNFGLKDQEVLKLICGGIDELYQKTEEVIPEFPVWIFNGNPLKNYQESLDLPKKNELCFCGSGKKFKHCCMKKIG